MTALKMTMIALPLLLIGCAAGPRHEEITTYHHATKPVAEFERDRYECNVDAREASEFDAVESKPGDQGEAGIANAILVLLARNKSAKQFHSCMINRFGWTGPKQQRGKAAYGGAP